MRETSMNVHSPLAVLPHMQGSTHVSWLAINNDGEQVELTPFSPVAQPALGESTPHPTAPLSEFKVEPEHIGHLIKFRVRPARDDGDVGHAESSRPTAEIATG